MLQQHLRGVSRGCWTASRMRSRAKQKTLQAERLRQNHRTAPLQFLKSLWVCSFITGPWRGHLLTGPEEMYCGYFFYLVFIIYRYKICATSNWMWQFIFVVINIRQHCSFAIIELIWLIYYHAIYIFLSSTNNHLNIFGLDLNCLKGTKMKCRQRG